MAVTDDNRQGVRAQDRLAGMRRRQLEVGTIQVCENVAPLKDTVTERDKIRCQLCGEVTSADEIKCLYGVYWLCPGCARLHKR